MSSSLVLVTKQSARAAVRERLGELQMVGRLKRSRFASEERRNDELEVRPVRTLIEIEERPKPSEALRRAIQGRITEFVDRWAMLRVEAWFKGNRFSIAPNPWKPTDDEIAAAERQARYPRPDRREKRRSLMPSQQEIQQAEAQAMELSYGRIGRQGELFVTVCEACMSESCFRGVVVCQDYKTAGVVEIPKISSYLGSNLSGPQSQNEDFSRKTVATIRE